MSDISEDTEVEIVPEPKYRPDWYDRASDDIQRRWCIVEEVLALGLEMSTTQKWLDMLEDWILNGPKKHKLKAVDS
ncbi:MAG: hypothetical protein KGJ90_00295 [Patescibacteria group bacterium]|nr:hypothetical protein [Patescibacteria group bacterium]